jgi:hypothetical protein
LIDNRWLATESRPPAAWVLGACACEPNYNHCDTCDARRAVQAKWDLEHSPEALATKLALAEAERDTITTQLEQAYRLHETAVASLRAEIAEVTAERDAMRRVLKRCEVHGVFGTELGTDISEVLGPEDGANV